MGASYIIPQLYFLRIILLSTGIRYLGVPVLNDACQDTALIQIRGQSRKDRMETNLPMPFPMHGKGTNHLPIEGSCRRIFGGGVEKFFRGKVLVKTPQNVYLGKSSREPSGNVYLRELQIENI